VNLGPTEIIIIAVVVMLLFGFKRLPDASRSIGRSLRIFKAETKGLRDDDVKAPPATADYTQTPDNEPSPLPAQTKTVQEQRLEAQRFLDATAAPAPAPSVPPTQPR
jgi:sec-independent protein translocase protein TatA